MTSHENPFSGGGGHDDTCGQTVTKKPTVASAPDDGQNNCPNQVDLTGIINKPLLLHLVGCIYYLFFITFFCDFLNNVNLFLYRMSCNS